MREGLGLGPRAWGLEAPPKVSMFHERGYRGPEPQAPSLQTSSRKPSTTLNVIMCLKLCVYIPMSFVCTCIYIYMYICMCIYIYIVYIYTHNIYVYLHMHVHCHMYIYIIQTCMHAYIHTYTLINLYKEPGTICRQSPMLTIEVLPGLNPYL